MNPKTIKDIQVAITCFDIELTDEQVVAIYSDKKFLLAQVEEYGANDTEVRDRLINPVVQWVGVEGKWPTYGTNGTEAKSFYFAFGLACADKGIKQYR